MDVCCVLPCRVTDHHRVDPLILPLSPFNGEDTVAFTGFNVDPAISLCEDLHRWTQRLNKLVWVEYFQTKKW